ncbi:MAG TPA: prolyl oligopeptidase family serine peptidase [Acidobacteriota bacterium]|nr:prolyl oligopeptidase family serine peptidase [Acidobacteriota bacterium]
MSSARFLQPDFFSPEPDVFRPMLPPPETLPIEIIDTLHGQTIVDPYRWLENGEATAVHDWTAQQNTYCRSVLDAFPYREYLRQQVTNCAQLGAISTPLVYGGKYFWTKRSGLQNQAVLYVRETLSGPDRVLVDPNTLSEHGTVTLDWWFPSPDGTRVAIGLSDNGSELSTLSILDVTTGEYLPDIIPDTRFVSLAWMPDGHGFYYTRYPGRGTRPTGQEHYHRWIYFHRLGSHFEADPVVFGPHRKPEEYFHVQVSPSGRYVLVTASRTFDYQDLYLLDVQSDLGFVPIVENINASFFGEFAGESVLIRTNWNAPRFCLMKVNLAELKAPWAMVIRQSASVLESFAVAHDHFVVCSYLTRAQSELRLFDLESSFTCSIPVPKYSTITGLSARWDSTKIFLSLTSFAVPTTVYCFETATQSLTLFDQIESLVDPASYIIKQVIYPSRDQTRVSMFIVHRKHLKFDGMAPTILTGYGGFNISRTPEFLGSLLTLLDAGAVYALPNVRGGGEYGEEWHKAGMRDRKQNGFDDFLCAAEYLIQHQYTCPEKLAIQGGSNGGLLVGAALTQRPDLFRAVVCQVPLLDMLRYHHFLIARTWIPEYGCAEDQDAFHWLMAYSPYHHVTPETPYPAVLLMTAQSDTRVDPLHARKMAARLQAATSSGYPILLRVESQAGHGVGKPTAKRIEESVDVLSFIAAQLGISL